jgi:hypothetical protein
MTSPGTWYAVVASTCALSLVAAGCFPSGGRSGLLLESIAGNAGRRPVERSPDASPQVDRYPVDAVVFGVFEGTNWRIVPYEGADRAAALAWLRSRQPLPHGVFAAVRQADGSYGVVTADHVRWE